MPSATTIRLLAKAGELVAVLAERGEAGAAELAQELDEPRPSVYRLIAALTEAHLVRPTTSGKVELGAGVLRLGEAAAEGMIERRAARPELVQLAAETGETAYLCVLRGTRALCIDRVEGLRVGLLILSPGNYLDLHAGGVSKVLLAYTPSLWSVILDRAPFPAFTGKTLRSAPELRRELEAIAARGYGVSDEDVTPGIAAVAAPVHDDSGRLRGAISAAGLREVTLAPDGRVIEAVLGAAARTGASLRADDIH